MPSWNLTPSRSLKREDLVVGRGGPLGGQQWLQLRFVGARPCTAAGPRRGSWSAAGPARRSRCRGPAAGPGPAGTTGAAPCRSAPRSGCRRPNPNCRKPLSVSTRRRPLRRQLSLVSDRLLHRVAPSRTGCGCESANASRISSLVRSAPVCRYSMASSAASCGMRRAADAVGDDPDVEVALVGVGERVVHADVGQSADQDQRRGPQPAQHDLEIGSDETGVAALDDVELVGLAGRSDGSRSVPGWPSTQCTPSVPSSSRPKSMPLGPMHLLEEHHRNAGCRAAASDQLSARSIRSASPGMCGMPTSPTGMSAALLHVDDDQHRVAHDQWLFRHLTSC